MTIGAPSRLEQGERGGGTKGAGASGTDPKREVMLGVLYCGSEAREYLGANRPSCGSGSRQ